MSCLITQGVRRRIVESAPLPGNWHNFLRVEELFSYLSKTLIRSFAHEGKELVVTDGDQVLCVPPQQNTLSLAPCSHEEADSRMMLHVAHAVQHVHHRILVRTVDTDVVVLAVMIAETLPVGGTFWIAFRTGKSFRYLAIHQIVACLGPDKSRAISMFRAFTGCDTVSAFVGHGNKSAWATWNSFPELTNALLNLSQSPTEIPEHCMQTIERFVILLYDRTSTCTDVNKARKYFLRRHLLYKDFRQHMQLWSSMSRELFIRVVMSGVKLLSHNLYFLLQTAGVGSKTDEELYEPLWIHFRKHPRSAMS